MPSHSSVDTKAAEHRTLRFGSIDDVLAEIERIVAAERAGTLRAAGNWTVGQTLGHLATWIDLPYDGYPPTMRPPWIVKVILRLQKNKFMRGPLPRGVRIPKMPEGTLGTEKLSTEEGLSRARAAFARLKAAPPGVPNIIMGPMTHEEWMVMHQRHAELHLGYLHP